MKLPTTGRVEIGVELIYEDEKIYIVIGGDKENKLDITYDAFALVSRCMADAAKRLGGNCEANLPEGKLKFFQYEDDLRIQILIGKKEGAE